MFNKPLELGYKSSPFVIDTCQRVKMATKTNSENSSDSSAAVANAETDNAKTAVNVASPIKEKNVVKNPMSGIEDQFLGVGAYVFFMVLLFTTYSWHF